MEAGKIKVFKPKSRFEKIDSVLIKNPNINLETIGFYCKLVALSDEWELSVDSMKDYLSVGKDKVRKLLANLETIGYIRRERCKNDTGKFIGWDYIVYPTPYHENADAQTEDETPQVGFSYLRKSPTSAILDFKEKEIKQEKENSPLYPPFKEKEINKEKETPKELFLHSSEIVRKIGKNSGLDDKIPYDEFKNLWNSVCVSLSKVSIVTNDRKTKIRCRVKEMGGIQEALDMFHRVFTEIQSSEFLKGNNDRGWKASFDWIINNGTNWVKVLEGKYDIMKNQYISKRDYEQQRRKTEAMQLTAHYIEESKRELAERNKIRND